MNKPKITIYSTKTCAFCRMLKDYLQKNHIEYDEKHADDDPKLAQELYEKSGQLGVPFTIVEQDGAETARILGFDKPQIDAVLGIH